MAQLSPFFAPQFLTDSGDLAAGFLLYTYDSGTTTPRVTYTDQAGTVNNTNPITLDAAGRCALWLDATGEYSFELRTPGNALVKRWDDVGGVPAPGSVAFLPLAGNATMTGRFDLAGSATSGLQPTPLQQVQALIAQLNSSLTGTLGNQMPVGSVAMWLRNAPPAGWLELNGSTVSRTTFPALFALWGTTFGAGDGSTTFGLPDARGEFPRFWDNGRGIDAGRAVASAQAELVGPHVHPFTVTAFNTDASGLGAITGGVNNTAGDGSFSGNTSNPSGAETRPRNFAFMAMVKATGTGVAGTFVSSINGQAGDVALPQIETIVCSDETTALTVGTAKLTMHAPAAMTLTKVWAGLSTAQVSGTIFTVNVKKNGVSIFSTKITIDNTEKTSLTAAAQPVLSTTTLAEGDEITVDIDQIGNSTAKGLKVYLVGR